MLRRLFAGICALCLLLCGICAQAEERVPVPLMTVDVDPADADYYQKAYETELYNMRVLRNFPMAFETEGYENFTSSANMLPKMDPAALTDAQKSTLDKLVAAQAELTQTVSYADVAWEIWGEDMPCSVDADALVFTPNSFDNADMRPYLTPYVLDDQSAVKGNLIVIAGGGYSTRNNRFEGFPIAEAFNERGYNCFLLERRVEPYGAEDSWMDLQRSIRYLRYRAEELGLGATDNFLAAGFSGGSGTALGAIMYLYGDVQPTIYDADYVPDEIDAMNADLDVAFLIYGPNPAPVHDGTYAGFVSDNPNPPDMFIAAGADDATGAPQDNWTLYESVYGKSMVELHTFATVGHGFGVGFEGTNSAYWMDMADQFNQLSLKAREKAAKDAEKAGK